MTDGLTFITTVGHQDHLPKVRLLIDSVRTFGGRLSGCPFLVYELDPVGTPCDQLRSDLIEIIQLSISESLTGYPFAGKVSACAHAERRRESESGQLVWISPDCLVVAEPHELVLTDTYDAALRPVHIRNVGLLAGEEPDEFWRGIYASVEGKITDVVLETFVDQQDVHAYFNTHTFSVRGNLGLMKRWLDAFIVLANDKSFQEAACVDVVARIFLHQAVLSAVLVTALPESRIHLLPSDYIYPYNLHASVSDHRRVSDMRELVTLAYEDRSLDPREVDDIQISEPLYSWLIERAHAVNRG